MRERSYYNLCFGKNPSSDLNIVQCEFQVDAEQKIHVFGITEYGEKLEIHEKRRMWYDYPEHSREHKNRISRKSCIPITFDNEQEALLTLLAMPDCKLTLPRVNGSMTFDIGVLSDLIALSFGAEPKEESYSSIDKIAEQDWLHRFNQHSM